jgi:hypothetical protein
MNRYSSGSDREFWLEAWNGRSHTVERMGRPPVSLDHLLVGVTGGLQPDKLVRAFDGDDDGMYARICFAWPSEPGYRQLSNEVGEVEPELINALVKLTRLGDLDCEGVFVPRAVPLSPSAVERFEKFRRFLHDKKEGIDGREREWWAKGASQVLRLAGTVAFLSWAWTDHHSASQTRSTKHPLTPRSLFGGIIFGTTPKRPYARLAPVDPTPMQGVLYCGLEQARRPTFR